MCVAVVVVVQTRADLLPVHTGTFSMYTRGEKGEEGSLPVLLTKNDPRRVTGCYPFLSLRIGREQHVPPEGNCGGNQL